jgi:putative tryptophan/tyrosine transport system substrate-binding protein
MAIGIGRRQFISTLGGVAVAWPLAARAQPVERKRHIAVLLGGLAQGDAQGQEEVGAFEEGLKQAGWIVGGNIEIDYRWLGAAADRMPAVAKEVADTHPDLVFTRSTPATATMRDANLPVVFVLVADPVGSGFIQSFAKPGGNFTGFTNVEPSVGGKWLALLKEAAPAIKRVALLFNPVTAPFAALYLRSAEQAAQQADVVLKPAPVGSPTDIEAVLGSLAGEGGFIFIADIFLQVHRDFIIELAARHRLPAIYANETAVPNGGLMSYAVNYPDIFQRAAHYVDLILKGAKPAELPSQLPTRFELALNLKTAKALGLTFPQMLLATADEVIE